MATGIRSAGEFCWINILTPNPAAACAFFGELLGWTYVEMPGMGFGVQVGGRDVGGLFDLHGPNTPPGTSAGITPVVKVSSADAAVTRVRALGGKAGDAFDVLAAGRMAVCHDPNGANFDVWEAKAMPGTDVDTALHGAPTWFETATTDLAVGSAFYAALFDWAPEAMPIPGIVYTNFKLRGEPVAGMEEIQTHGAATTPVWATYFTVTSADDTAMIAKRLGGAVTVSPQDVPGVGRFAGLVSPQGVPFFVMQYGY